MGRSPSLLVLSLISIAAMMPPSSCARSVAARGCGQCSRSLPVDGARRRGIVASKRDAVRDYGRALSSFQTAAGRMAAPRRQPSLHSDHHQSIAHWPVFSNAPHHSLLQGTANNRVATRLFSTTEEEAAVQRSEVGRANGEGLLDPFDVLRSLQTQGGGSGSDAQPKIPFPTHLSPTSLEQFSKCPQAFFFLYVLKLSPDPPMTPQLARGIICHTALEEVYDLKPEDRSLSNLENLFRREWGRLRGNRDGKASAEDPSSNSNRKEQKEYDFLFRNQGDDGSYLASYDIEGEIDWGKSSLRLLRHYYDLEDPRTVTSPNPLAREMWVQARFPLDGHRSDDDDDVDGRGEFLVRGKIDRIDVLDVLPALPSDKLRLQIIDYKTGKKPWLKYSPAVNERIRNEQVWKMKVYALILSKMIARTDEASSEERSAGLEHQQQGGEQQKDLYKYCMPWSLQQRLMSAMERVQRPRPNWGDVIELDSLRLTYLASHVDDASVNGGFAATTDGDGNGEVGRATYLDYPLGSSRTVDVRTVLDETEREVTTIAKNIRALVDAQDPTAFEHCDWRYCSCHELRRRFRPGSVYCSPELYS